MTVSIIGNLEIGRINIEGQNYLTVKVDRDGGPMIYENDGSTKEILFCHPAEDLDGRDPNKCLRLRSHDGTDDVILVGN